MGPRGQPWLSRPHVAVTPEAEGGHRVQIRIDRERDLGWALSEVRKKLPDAKLDQQAIKKLGVRKTERLGGEVSFDLNLGGGAFFRAVLKCCANLFAAHAPAARAAFLGPAFDAVRGFVKDGAGQTGDFARWLLSAEPLELPRRGQADQTIVLTTRGGSVEGVMRFFGHLPFAVRLATGYDGPSVRCAYVVDPYREADPAERRLSGGELATYDDLLPVFAEQSPGNTTAVQVAWDAALSRFIAHYIERENEDRVQKAVDAARQMNPWIAAMPREEVVEMMRRKAGERLQRFKETGDASGITVIRTQPGGAVRTDAGG